MLSNGIDKHQCTSEERSKIMLRFELKARKGVLFKIRSALQELTHPYTLSPSAPIQACLLFSMPSMPAMVQTILSYVDQLSISLCTFSHCLPQCIFHPSQYNRQVSFKSLNGLHHWINVRLMTHETLLTLTMTLNSALMGTMAKELTQSG